MRHHRRIVLAAPALALACIPACATDAPEDTPPPPPAITGINRVVHWDDAGHATEVARPPTLDVFIEAEIPGPGGTEVRPAAIADDGSFAIAGDAPTAPYWLRVDDGQISREDVYLLTDATQLDLGRDVVGTLTPIADNHATQLVVGATGLDIWQDGDDGDFFITNLGFLVTSFTPYYATNTPVAGDTAFQDLTFGWMGRPLPTSSQDDRATFVQLRHAHDDALGFDYLAPITQFVSGAFAMTDAGTTRLDGTFERLPALDIPIHWARSAFAAQADAMHGPDCTHQLDTETYWVHALPGHGAHGVLVGTVPDPVIGDFGPRVIDDVFTDTLDDVAGVFHVASPYPADWMYASYTFTYDTACPAPGVRMPAQRIGQVGVVTAAFGAAPVAPMVTPPRAPTINGRDLFAPQTAVGLQPTIAWTAPAVGVPTSYELSLSEAFVSGLQGNGLTVREDATLIVPGDVTSITLPRETLADGVMYTLRIRAVLRTGQAVKTAPFRSGVPYGYADVLTSFFTP
ncbi:MAG: hypothetical protein K8W52_01825 [Deltaproteobacteria bacterium]|nr:hypothetical protein [Deltaproteobacteria bacterium]